MWKSPERLRNPNPAKNEKKISLMKGAVLKRGKRIARLRNTIGSSLTHCFLLKQKKNKLGENI